MILRNEKVFCGSVDKPQVVVQKTPFSVHIDFNTASQAWRQNKIHVGEGIFRYKKTRTR